MVGRGVGVICFNILRVSFYYHNSAEMHGSESIKQVHAELVDLMGEVPEEIAEEIVGILYDDM